ncbi:MAG: hypothetical protein AB7I42_24260 [Bradyrhizobium sp.]|uniref:hypothetical protein n=1 Tax=Bradyrhizobium sp. TaxID=376 RepID=UPI003D1407EC
MERIIANSTEERDALAERGGLIGAARLWVAGNPPTPTDRWVVWTERTIAELSDLPRVRQIRTRQRTRITQEADVHLTRGGRQGLAEYGSAARRVFHMDIVLPQTVVDDLEAP